MATSSNDSSAGKAEGGIDSKSAGSSKSRSKSAVRHLKQARGQTGFGKPSSTTAQQELAASLNGHAAKPRPTAEEVEKAAEDAAREAEMRNQLDELFLYVGMYAAKETCMDMPLAPFIPGFIPAIGVPGRASFCPAPAPAAAGGHGAPAVLRANKGPPRHSSWETMFPIVVVVVVDVVVVVGWGVRSTNQVSAREDHH
jgi:hypothetical protein